MTLSSKNKLDLDKKFQKIQKTPASYDFFVAIHDFVEFIESRPILLAGLSSGFKMGKSPNIAAKYANLKEVYQGLEDTSTKNRSSGDLGHDRYIAILELRRIRDNEISESNSFWKKREAFRKSMVEIHDGLSLYLS